VPGTQGCLALFLFEQLKREGKMILSKRNETLVKKPQITEMEKKIEWESVYNEVRADRF
jgi:hypothetical protein